MEKSTEPRFESSLYALCSMFYALPQHLCDVQNQESASLLDISGLLQDPHHPPKLTLRVAILLTS